MSCAGCEDCVFAKKQKDKYFEIHVTVNDSTRFDNRGERFIDACEDIGARALFIANVIDENGSYLTDTMSRSTIKGEMADAALEMLRVQTHLHKNGFNVVRNKIEAVPWYYDEIKETALMHMQPALPYFETHIDVDCDPLNNQTLKELYNFAKAIGTYVSFNINNPNKAMVTFRQGGVTPTFFEGESKWVVSRLNQAGWKTNRNIIELTFFDDNKSHDDNWIRNSV